MKFCLYCPENCTVKGEHHHYPGKKFDAHPGTKLPREFGGIPESLPDTNGENDGTE